MTRTCDCGEALGKRNRSGRCRSCSARRRLGAPEMRAKAVAGLRKHFTDPLARAQHAARSQERLAKWRAENPEQARAVGQIRIRLAQAHLASPEREAARRLAIRRTMLAGIPEARWDEYGRLAKKMLAAEARRIIAEDEAAIERRRLSGMTALERQLEQVRKGASVVDKPVLRTRDHDFTLGGIASAFL